jgi:Ketosteroid isomerase-related protein
LIGGQKLSITVKQIQNIFNNLDNGENEKFFEHVADNVCWKVMGTHPLAGTYSSKQDFLAHTFARLNKILKEGVVLKVTGIIVQDDTAAVELETHSSALNGMPFNNRYCWIVKFKNEIIVEVHAYLDSALVQKVIDENEAS